MAHGRLTPAQRAQRDRNALRMSSAELRMLVSGIAVNGPQPPTEAEMEREASDHTRP